jgi:hypothetical protein
MPEYEPFPGLICAYIRNIVKARRKAQSEREQAFEERDEATRKIGEAMMGQEPTEPHEAEYGRAVMRLDVLAQRLKYLEGELDKAIENADEAELPFKTAKLDIPDFKPRAKHAEPKPKEREAEEKAPDRDQMELAEGQDEHLQADINELDISDADKAKLRKGGYDRISQIALALDKSEDLREKLNVGENVAARIIKAVKAFRSEHRKAKREAEITA